MRGPDPGSLPKNHPYGRVNEESDCVSCRMGTAPIGERECAFCRGIDPDGELRPRERT